MQTIFIHHRSTHHAKNSGYSRLIDYFPDPTSIYGRNIMPYKIAKLISKVSSKQAGLYDSTSVMKEYELLRVLKSNKSKASIVHYLNGERDVRFNVKYNRRKNLKYFASFHKPPAILKTQITNLSYLKSLNAAVCVGENQVDFIKECLHLEHVKYIPHGVDTQFFTPLASKTTVKQSKNILFVGQHLRDFKTFNTVIKVLIEKIKGVQVDVILRKEYATEIRLHDKIKIHHNINDIELRSFYQKADVLFLPLLDATACNSILEALACGLPIVTSDVGGVSSYLRNTGNFLLSDQDAYIETLVKILKNPEQLENISRLSRQKALEYDWMEIANRVSEFHNLVMNN
ncbi:glycosyltransferase family 4 protein [Mesonia sediminis]|uniref:Glycosyltransferase family 4 protein n=1 Tax=Mesonia sediminis TaxID=1703946 RepID=A0ABW5SH35_9FLAO